MSVFDILKERDMIAQQTHPEKIKSVLENEKVTFYIGFDPTADSLHVGHFLQMMVMAHMQRAGHRPIAIIGGGTAMVGDPTGKTDMRKMMTKEEIQKNAENFKKQLSNFIDFSDGKALMIDNADWLLELKYVDFLREIGVHFSVNKMLAFESVKSRLERGLNFIEFNYPLMQSYDFYKLYKDYNCILQLGGDDQWSNIIGGIELVRRCLSKEVYGMTFNLLTTSEGKKMGKTEKGALWLDKNKTTPYDFYQYWRNISDSDVIKCLKMLTFLPLDEIEKLSKLKDKEINEAKKVLAFEVTKLIHGEIEAKNAKQATEAVFEKGTNSDNMPTVYLDKSDIENQINILDMLFKLSIIPSKAEGRRLIEQNGLSIDDIKITEISKMMTINDFKDNFIVVKKGKKNFYKVEIKI